MNPRLLLLLAVFLVFLPSTIWAREVRLKKGEVYRDRDLAVICEGGQARSSGQTLVVHGCLSLRCW